jgi:hypothetical protein
MEFKNKNILIISPTAWDVNFSARQFYARELAKMGNNVYFLNPPSEVNSAIEISDRLHVVDYALPFNFFGLIDNRSDKKLAQKIIKLTGKKIDLVWNFDLDRFPDMTCFENCIRIFSLEKFPENNLLSKNIGESADLILAMSQPLYEVIGKVKAQKQIFQHALGSVFEEAINKKDSIKSVTQFTTGRVRCGYLGNLQNPYIDKVNFEKIIRENQIVEFHLIGPFVKNSNLAQSQNKTWEDPFIEFLMSAPNVRLYGSLMTVRTAELLQTMDMFLLCYDVEKYAKYVANPPKIMEYLSVGKAIVANQTKGFLGNNDIIIMAKNNRELPNLFKDTVNNLEYHNREELASKRIKFALYHSYEKQLRKIQAMLNEIGK